MLMIPGPSEPEPAALVALSLPIMPHYGNDWGSYYMETISKLSKIFKTKKSDGFILPTPGQVAVEMAAENFVKKGDVAYVCASGFFSEMIEDIVQSHGAKPVRIRNLGYGKAITLEEVKQELEQKDVSGRVVFLVHNETSTGVTNPAEEIMRYCKQQKGMITVLDCISSFGGIDIRVDDWKVDFCVGYASKALGGVFGAVPVAVSQDAWKVAERNKDGIVGRFLNMNTWAKYAKKWARIGHPHPSTMPTSIIVALNKAVDIALSEGLERRYERHKKVADLARKGLKSLDLELFPDERYASNTVSVARIDPVRDRILRSELENKYDIMIGGGIDELEGKIIRIGHMGTSATVAKVSMTIEAMRAILKDVAEKRKKRGKKIKD
jgi:alanine-glyoxylate transaminase/serine-glyoxylate transaminase/serine-pyruvate transaminase